MANNKQYVVGGKLEFRLFVLARQHTIPYRAHRVLCKFWGLTDPSSGAPPMPQPTAKCVGIGIGPSELHGTALPIHICALRWPLVMRMRPRLTISPCLQSTGNLRAQAHLTWRSKSHPTPKSNEDCENSSCLSNETGSAFKRRARLKKRANDIPENTDGNPPRTETRKHHRKTVKTTTKLTPDKCKNGAKSGPKTVQGGAPGSKKIPEK